MWIEIDNVYINVGSITSFSIEYVDLLEQESLVIVTDSGNYIVDYNANERYEKLKEVLFEHELCQRLLIKL